MTNKEHIQQQMELEINAVFSNPELPIHSAADSCTSIAEQCMGEFLKWLTAEFSSGDFYPELVQLYLNQTK